MATPKESSMTREQLEAWLLNGLSYQEPSTVNPFLPEAGLDSQWNEFIESGTLQRIAYGEFELQKAERLREITPTNTWEYAADYTGDSITGRKQIVAQIGRGNRYMEITELLETAGLEKHEISARPSHESGAGHGISKVRFNIWLDPEDHSNRVYATDFVESSYFVRTGDLLGGPNSMHSETTYGTRILRVDQSLLGDTHLAFISTSKIAHAFRSLFT